MNTTFRTILKGLGFAVITLLIINLVGFALELIRSGISEDWMFKFKHGVFYVNGSPTGLAFGQTSANIIMIVAFLFYLFNNRKNWI